MDTLAVRLTVPPVGPVGDFHSQVSAPCRAHNKKGRGVPRPLNCENESKLAYGHGRAGIACPELGRIAFGQSVNQLLMKVVVPR